MNQPTLRQIKAAYSSKVYKYFEDIKPYNLNLWIIRKQFGEINKFDKEVLQHKSKLRTL